MHDLGSVGGSCDITASFLTRALQDQGYLVSRSFDLQSARRGLRAPDECPCPAHGTSSCTCQYIVLMVSRGEGDPSAITLHGHGDRTYLAIPTYGRVEELGALLDAASEAMKELDPAWVGAE